MAGEIDFELIEKIRDIMQKEMSDRGVTEEDMKLLENDRPGYFDELIESILGDVYEIIGDKISDDVITDIDILKDDAPDDKNFFNTDDEIEEPVAVIEKKKSSTLDWGADVDWRKK